MSHSFSYPRAVIGVLADLWDAAVMVVEMLIIDVRANTATDSLTDVMVDVDVDMSSDVGMIIVVATVVITLDFAVPVPYAVGVVAVVISCGVFDIGVDILAANGVAAVTVPLELAFPSPWEESMSF